MTWIEQAHSTPMDFFEDNEVFTLQVHQRRQR